MSQHRVDELDRAIIDILSRDARVSNRQIATDLGVTEGTIRGRIRRLESERLIRFTALTNQAQSANLKLVFIGIHAERDKIYDIVDAISAMPMINCCVTLLGRFDILAVGLFRDLQHLLEEMNGHISVMPGVRNVETWVTIKTIKTNHHIVRIMDDAFDTDPSHNAH